MFRSKHILLTLRSRISSAPADFIHQWWIYPIEVGFIPPSVDFIAHTVRFVTWSHTCAHTLDKRKNPWYNTLDPDKKRRLTER